MAKSARHLTASAQASVSRLIDASEWQHQRWGWLEGVRRDPTINAQAKLVAHVLALDYAHHATLRCDPSIREIANLCGVSTDTAKRAVAALVEAEWIVRQCGLGRGRNSGYGFLTRAKIIQLKGGKTAPPDGANLHPFKGSEKGANLRGKGGKSAPRYNKAKPCKNHGAQNGEVVDKKSSTVSRVLETAEFLSKRVKDGRYVTVSAFTSTIIQTILDQGLLTAAELRAVGVDC